jgi:multiple sugar transport system ATP-binding protein
MNTIDVEVRGDGASLDTPFGVLPVPAVAGGLSAGEPLVLGVRPWDLRLAQGAMPTVVPSVQQLEPLGDVTIVSLVANGTSLRIVLPEAQAVGMKAGDTLPIVIDAAKLHLFRKHGGSALNRQS